MKTRSYKALACFQWFLFGVSLFNGMVLCMGGTLLSTLAGWLWGGLAIFMLFQNRRLHRFQKQVKQSEFWIDEMKRILEESIKAANNPERFEQLQEQFRVASHRADKEVELLGKL